MARGPRLVWFIKKKRHQMRDADPKLLDLVFFLRLLNFLWLSFANLAESVIKFALLAFLSKREIIFLFLISFFKIIWNKNNISYFFELFIFYIQFQHLHNSFVFQKAIIPQAVVYVSTEFLESTCWSLQKNNDWHFERAVGRQHAGSTLFCSLGSQQCQRVWAKSNNALVPLYKT